MTLYMLQFTPDLPKLVRWAETQLLLHPRAEDDLGYALHALLKAAFDTLTPAPFALLRNPGRPAKLLAYSAHPGAALRDHATTFAEPFVATLIGVPEMVDKQMPDRFVIGRRLGFTLRARPTVRTDRDGDRSRARERMRFSRQSLTLNPVRARAAAKFIRTGWRSVLRRAARGLNSWCWSRFD